MTTLRSLAQLRASGLMTQERQASLEKVVDRYAVAVPDALTQLIDRNDPHDPIARQFIPDIQELDHQVGEDEDPIGDDAHSPVEGIVHRYPDRVLFKPTHICAVYCRFCFRREMVGPGKPNALSHEAMERALDYIRTHSRIWEVILTGGDPLILSARRLRSIMNSLAKIDHVKVVRIHTRVPIAEPARVTRELVRAMKVSRKATYVALHVNHPRELAVRARAACASIADAGIPLLSQTVLLAGVNDAPEVMGQLMRTLVECRIKPYYLHQGDMAKGTSHFRTDLAIGQELMRALRAQTAILMLSSKTTTGSGTATPGQCRMANRSRRAAATARLANPMNTTAITACHTKVASRLRDATTFLLLIIA
jgi:lysine 2,3-aminomutase